MLGKLFVDTVLLCSIKWLNCFKMTVIISAYISTKACTMKRVVCLAATGEGPPSKTYTFLTSVHNDAEDADATDKTDVADDTDDANDYNRVIGIALLKAFSCANKCSTKVTIVKATMALLDYNNF